MSAQTILADWFFFATWFIHFIPTQWLLEDIALFVLTYDIWTWSHYFFYKTEVDLTVQSAMSNLSSTVVFAAINIVQAQPTKLTLLSFSHLLW